VLTQESFAEAGGAPGSLVTYNVGRVSILLPTQAENVAASLAPYNLGDLMQFDALSDAIHPDFQVSMVEFRMSPNEVEGSNSVTAKFKIFNKSDRPMAVPEFQADLVSSDGYLYAGSRQTIASQSILPNSGFVIGYSFILPSTETGQGLGIKIQDAKTAAPAKTTIAAYSASLQEGIDDKAFTIYPFDVKIPYYTIAPMYNVGNNGKYTYKLRLDLDVQRDPAIQVDNNFSKLYFEVYDTIGRQIGGTEASFVGLNRLVTGENNIYLNSTSEQQEQRITVKVYEKFTTPSGDAKRLLGELHN
jgi:hypothetical protein